MTPIYEVLTLEKTVAELRLRIAHQSAEIRRLHALNARKKHAIKRMRNSRKAWLEALSLHLTTEQLAQVEGNARMILGLPPVDAKPATMVP